MDTAIWWIRRDLRLNDNTALYAALTTAAIVIPVFILDDRLLHAPRLKGARTAWMLQGLQVLDQDIQRLGGRLIVRHGPPVSEMLAVCHESGAAAVFWNRDYSPYALKRDQSVRQALNKAGVSTHDFKDLILHEPNEIPTRTGKPYEVYTPFSKAWHAVPKPPRLPDLERSELKRLNPPIGLRSDPLPTPEELGITAAPAPIVPPGEKPALNRLADFLHKPVYGYKEGRNDLPSPATSILSPYLRWGMISPRVCLGEAQRVLERTPDPEARGGIVSWISELIWREFNYSILINHPRIVRQNFRPQYDAIQWGNNPQWLDAWQSAQTGYPIVDAAIRQLLEAGWMHNRARMIVASFLCKDLLIDWRQGEAFFMRHLLDGDLANNVGGWQWTAGTGTDAAPYFRIFNPHAQSQKYDPQGEYIKTYVPALKNVPPAYIHAPHLMPRTLQERTGCVIGQDYPLPIVHHDQQRPKALMMYSAART
ncbi:Deoxyribodipyrimidine photo-lyase [Anaerolineae bacterium]|nr:Deoxyribodipyrimidine photo-lyase [Anaerolineae bacterium]